jgi:hypothetical protein
MLLSRFWLVVVGLALGMAIFVLSIAQSVHNRATARALGEGLSADSQVVGWYLRDDARMRAGHLIKFALDQDVAKGLQGASKSETKLPGAFRESVLSALKKINQTIPEDQAFDAVFAIDQHGRVVAQVGFPQAQGMEDFELGGYPVVADALHGFVRDDTLVWDRTYRVVARPVEFEAGAEPAGAIVGARIIDDKFARELSERTGAAVAFYVGGQRTAAGAPEAFPKANLDQLISDLEGLEKTDADYKDKGRSSVREIKGVTSVYIQYTRLQGEAFQLGAGYAVARMGTNVTSPFAFFKVADDKDKAAADKMLAILCAVAAIVLGLLLSWLEHTRPLRKFEGEAAKLGKGEIDQLSPSRFGGIYRKIAAELNDGIDKVASSQGGISRKAADLTQVLGDLPAQPQMAAFAVPGGDSPPASAASPALPSPPGRRPPPGRPPGATPAQPAVSADPEAEWQRVFEQFVATKQQCGEPIDGFTYEKFRVTLVKNQEALRARHGAAQVKFTVYVKDGRAAVKASPIG